MSLKALLMTIRGPFLILPPACVFLAVCGMVYQGMTIDWGLAALVLAGAILAHISVNTFNEYADLRSGLDFNTTRTPFSGGSGALPAHPEMANSVLVLALTTLILTASIGLYLISLQGWAIAPLGLIGMATIVLYTPWLNRSALACLIAPGLGFGFVMVVGTQLALSGEHSPLAWLIATVPFFQVNNLLLLNQLPDLKADERAGRRHLAIRHGVGAATATYGCFALAPPAITLAAVLSDMLPAWCLLALLSLPATLFSWKGARLHGAQIGQYPQFLAANVLTAVLTPVLLGAGLLIESLV